LEEAKSKEEKVLMQFYERLVAARD